MWYESLVFEIAFLKVLLGFSRSLGHVGALLGWGARIRT